MVDILMNSIQYYQMKYDGELETMQEVFPIIDPTQHKSSLQEVNAKSQNEDA